MKASDLSHYCQITPEPSDPPDFARFLLELRATLASGIELVQLRAKHLDRHSHLHLARQSLDICREHGATLIFNGSVEMALAAGCDGVHLDSRTLMSLHQRPPQGLLVSAACHSAEQLAQAARIGVDFVTLSPVYPTQTHPEALPLGWQRFTELVAGTDLRVFALGGMLPEMTEETRKAGAWGIAAISATWQKAGESK